MALSRYGGVTGTKNISEDFENINVALNNVAAENDGVKSDIGRNKQDIEDHLNSITAHPAEHITYAGEVVGAKDTKEALDKLKTTIDDLILGSGDSGPEVAAARNGYATLGDRLDATDVWLEDVKSKENSRVINVMFPPPPLIAAKADWNGTIGTDDSSAIQSCIDLVSNNGGGEVYLPKGNYFIGSTLTLKKGVSLRGSGYSNWDYRFVTGTWLVMKNTLPTLLQIGNNSSGFANGCSVSNLSLTVEGFTNGGSVHGVGLWERNSDYFVSRDIYVEGFAFGIRVGDSAIRKILNHWYENTNISECNTFIHILSAADVTFNGGRIGTNSGNGVARTQQILIEGTCDSLTFNRLILAHNAGTSYNVYITNVTAAFWITFNDCDMEKSTVNSVSCNSLATKIRINNSWVGHRGMLFIAGSRVIIRDCTFSSHGGINGVIYIAGTTSNVDIQNCDFTSAANSQIIVSTSGDGVNIRDCLFSTGGTGVLLNPGTGNPKRWVVKGCKFINQSDNAISVNSGVLSRIHLLDNFISDYTNHGILYTNSIIDVSMRIQGNRIETTKESGTRRPIYLASAMSGVIVTDNDLRGNTLSMLDNSVAPKVVVNNLP